MFSKMIIDQHEGEGEDMAIAGAQYAAVFDGLGGRGSTVYRNKTDSRQWTEAKIASSLAAETAESIINNRLPIWTQRFLDAKEDGQDTVASELTEEIKIAIRQKLNQAAGQWEPVSSSVTRNLILPTTIASILVFPSSDCTYALAIWAGDSRCYLMDTEGLHQLSIDDGHPDDRMDAMQDLLSAGSAEMSNRIGNDMEYVFHHRIIKVAGIGILFCASDGIYGYHRSPMHLELLLRLCGRYETLSQWEEQMSKYYRRHDNDDASIAALFVNCSNPGQFSDFGTMLTDTLQSLKDTYIDCFPRMPAEEIADDSDSEINRLCDALQEDACFKKACIWFLDSRAQRPDHLAYGSVIDTFINDYQEKFREEKQTEHILAECKDRQRISERELINAISSSGITVQCTLFQNNSYYNHPENIDVGSEAKRIHDFVNYYFPRYGQEFNESEIYNATLCFGESIMALIKYTNYFFQHYRINMPRLFQDQKYERGLNKAERDELFSALVHGQQSKTGIPSHFRLTLEQFEKLNNSRNNYLEALGQVNNYQGQITNIKAQIQDAVSAYVEKNLYQLALWYITWYEEHMHRPFIIDNTSITALVDKGISNIKKIREQHKQTVTQSKSYLDTIWDLWYKYKPRYEKYMMN